MLRLCRSQGSQPLSCHEIAQVSEQVQQSLRHRGYGVGRQELLEAGAAQLMTVRHEVAHRNVKLREARLCSQQVQSKLEPRRQLRGVGGHSAPTGVKSGCCGARVDLYQQALYEDGHCAEKLPSLVQERGDRPEVQADVLRALVAPPFLVPGHRLGQVQGQRHELLGQVQQHGQCLQQVAWLRQHAAEVEAAAKAAATCISLNHQLHFRRQQTCIVYNRLDTVLGLGTTVTGGSGDRLPTPMLDQTFQQRVGQAPLGRHLRGAELQHPVHDHKALDSNNMVGAERALADPLQDPPAVRPLAHLGHNAPELVLRQGLAALAVGGLQDQASAIPNAGILSEG
mmetsp:Transcript_71173/g.128156  ORF Transcript_71173/g.128156 Transcript_71173/m.128156 type:complete len:340 (+) Transcript_71173:830-1849(+)